MLDPLYDAAPYLIVAALAFLAGAALGNYTAHADHERNDRDHAE